MRLLTAISLALVVLMAPACWATPAEPTPNIDATVEAQVKQKVASTVAAMSPTTSPQISLPTPVPDDLIHVGETIEKQKRFTGQTNSVICTYLLSKYNTEGGAKKPLR